MFTITINPEELKDIVVDPALVKLYHKYIKAGKEHEFILMLYVILAGSADVEQQQEDEVAAKRRQKEEKKNRQKKWEEYLESLPIEKWAKIINTPFEHLPKKVKEIYPYTVPKHKEMFDDFRMLERVKKNDRQIENFGARFVRYLEKNEFVTSMEGKTIIHYDRVANQVNKYLEQFDKPATKYLPAHYVRVSAAAIKDYCTKLTTPKRSRFTGIAQALDIPEVYLAGYLEWMFEEGSPVPKKEAA